MRKISKTRIWLPILVLGMALAVAQPAHVAVAATGASFQVTFGTAPHWDGIPGTRVREIRTAERPDYDMFQYGGNYYAYNNNHWYSSCHSSGQFREIESRRVPGALSKVPSEHWHNYPSGWGDKNQHPGNSGQHH